MIRFFNLLALFIITVGIAGAQDVYFNYDNNGNRIEQEVILLRSLLSIEEEVTTADTTSWKFKANGVSQEILIYPNPVNTLLYVCVRGYLADGTGKLKVYSINSSSVIYEDNLGTTTQIDFSQIQSGTYILWIYNNETQNQKMWKIIKQ